LPTAVKKDSIRGGLKEISLPRIGFKTGLLGERYSVEGELEILG